MSEEQKVANQSSMGVLQTVRWLIKQQFKPVPLRFAHKSAISNSYVAKDYIPPEEEFWIKNRHDVGVVTGPAHGGPVDADVDCDEALFFAARFLPPTEAVFGRASKKASHYLYRVNEQFFIKKSYLDPVRNETIIELRGDGGHQTVMPGSTHEGTGEIIEWNGGSAPSTLTTLDSIDLIKAADKVVICVLIVRYMWSPGYHNEPIKHLSGIFYHLDWPLEEVQEMFQAIMEYTGDKDKSRMPTIKRTYDRAANGEKVTGPTRLKEQIGPEYAKAVDRLLELAGAPVDTVMLDYNDRFAVVSMEGKFRIMKTAVAPGQPPIFYTAEDFVRQYQIELSEVVSDKGKRVPKPIVWMNSHKRRQYDGVDFLPGEGEAIILQHGNHFTRLYNMWMGWAVDENPEGSCKAWLRLLKEVICGGDNTLYNWMLHWFANIVREPTAKSMTAPVIIGPEGAGKSLLLGYFGQILGQSYVVATNEEHIHGRFNKHMATALLLHSEEALYGGDKKHAAIIRSLITDEYMMFEPKTVDAKKIRSFVRLILTSNETHAAPVKAGDRRYTVIMMGERKASKDLIRKVLEEKDNGGPGALLHYLKTMKYDPKVPRENVKNKELDELKRINLPPIAQWWRECLMSGEMLPPMLGWAQKPENVGWPTVIAGAAQRASFQMYLRQNGLNRTVPISPNAFQSELERMMGRKHLARAQRYFVCPWGDDGESRSEYPLEMRDLYGGRMYATLDMPSLEECRAAFDRHMGTATDWPNVEKTPEDLAAEAEAEAAKEKDLPTTLKKGGKHRP